VALLILLLGGAMVNGTSNVLFMPYMACFHPAYLPAYFLGMGLSALVPSLVALAQGASRIDCVFNNGTWSANSLPARFGISEYLLIMLAWLFVATVAFVLLHRRNETLPVVKADPADEIQPLNCSIEKQTTPTEKTTLRRHIYFLILMGIICAQMNGVVPSIQSFAALPYSQMTYHLALTLANVASPLVCFLPLLFSQPSTVTISILTIIGTLLTTGIFVLAVMSPYPPLHDMIWGSILCVTISVASSAFHSYLRTVLASSLHRGLSTDEMGLFWCGVFIQVGSFMGALFMFPLVNGFNIFHSASPCS